MSLNSTTLPKVCPQCGNPVRKADRICCSRVCADAYRKRGRQIACATCGVVFYAYPSQIAAGKAYCSHKCKGARTTQVMKGRAKTAEQRAKLSAAMNGRRSPRKKIDYILTCRQCGNSFTVPSKERKRASVARFCGTACWYTFIREHPEQNTLFQGGRFPYYGSNWAEQARKARRRDKYTCQDCHKRQIRPALDVHHIRSRREFGGDWRAANALDNLVSLCKSCHTKREHAERSP